MSLLTGAALQTAGLDAATAEAFVTAYEALCTGFGADVLGLWRHVAKELLGPAQPFEVHRVVHSIVFADWPASLGPAPIWVPGPRELESSNVARMIRALEVADYAALHAFSVAEPERYWRYVLDALQLAPALAGARVLMAEDGPESALWLVGMRANLAEAALARSESNRVAVVFQAEGGGLERRTLAELEADSERVARGLSGLGLTEGDAIAIAMPMTYESVAIYLGIVRLGGIVVSIADSFAAGEIALRLRIGEAKLVFTQDVIARSGKALPLYERVQAATVGTAVRAIVLPASGTLALPLDTRDVSWDAFLAGGAGQPRSAAEYCPRSAEDVTNILFSSGTTGEPKAIPWTMHAPLKAAADAFAHHDLKRGDVVCWPTNLGWMMGPWLIYAALLNDATIALYEGSPLGRDFGRFVEDARVTMLGVVPSLVKTWKASACMDGLDWSRIRCFSSTGEASTPHEMHWLSARGGYKPVIEYCGGTEIGGAYITGTVIQPQAPSAFSTPALGCAFVLIDDDGNECDQGELALIPPLFGSSNRLLNRDHHESYYADMPKGPKGEVLRRHGDQVERLGGSYRALGRVDDTMNLGGIKTSSAELERICNRVGGVLESAAIAVPPVVGGPSLLVVYVVMADGNTSELPALQLELQRALARELNPLFKVHELVLTAQLPRTASNKVLRRVLRGEYLAQKR